MRHFTLAATALIGTTSALAHDGPRIWIGQRDGRIATFASDNDLDPTIYRPARAFGAQFNNFFDIYTTEFPGFEVRRDNDTLGALAVAGETRFGFNILTPLYRFWPGVREEEPQLQAISAVPLPKPTAFEHLLISQGSRQAVTTNEPVAGYDFFDFFGVGDHSHLAFTYVNRDLTPGNAEGGIYAIGLELTSPTMASSEPFFVLFGKDIEVGDARFAVAMGAVSQIVIPEPSMMPVVVVAWMTMVRRSAARAPTPQG